MGAFWVYVFKLQHLPCSPRYGPSFTTTKKPFWHWQGHNLCCESLLGDTRLWPVLGSVCCTTVGLINHLLQSYCEFDSLALTVDSDLHCPDIRAWDVIRSNAFIWSWLLFGDGCQFQVLALHHKSVGSCGEKTCACINILIWGISNLWLTDFWLPKTKFYWHRFCIKLQFKGSYIAK